MFWRGATLAVAAVVMAGCATQMSGVYYSGMVAPRPGHARIVVFQEKRPGLGLDKTSCDIKLDGVAISRLLPGTYLYADRPAGRHELLASEDLFPADTRLDVTMEAGRTYFFVVRSSKRHDAMTGFALAGGLAGVVVGAAVTSGNDNSGPVDFVPLDEATARTAIAELQLAK